MLFLVHLTPAITINEHCFVDSIILCVTPWGLYFHFSLYL